MLTFFGDIVTDGLVPILSYQLKYSFIDAGVKVEIKYSINEHCDTVHRLGFYTALSNDYDLIEYFGYGEGETYVDCFYSADFGYYTTSPDEEYHAYTKPQESGSHYGTRKLQISDKSHSLVFDGEFSFSYIPYSISQLTQKEHGFELVKDDKNYLAIDFFMSGCGSSSCGPNLKQEYKVPRKAKKSFVISIR